MTCLFVYLYPINVKTFEPIRPKNCVMVNHLTPCKDCLWTVKNETFCPEKKLDI